MINKTNTKEKGYIDGFGLLMMLVMILFFILTTGYSIYTSAQTSYDVDQIEKVDNGTFVAEVIENGPGGGYTETYIDVYYDINDDGNQEYIDKFYSKNGGNEVFELPDSIDRGDEIRVKNSYINKTYTIK